MNMIANVIDTH